MSFRKFFVFGFWLLLTAGCSSQVALNIVPGSASLAPDPSPTVVPTLPVAALVEPTGTASPQPAPTLHPTEVLPPTAEPPAIPGIILFVGDGMGAAHRLAATWLVKGEAGLLIMDSLLVHGWAQTSAVNGAVPDSASAGTAFATGSQTHNRVISMDTKGHPLTTILELAEQKGWATGLVTTVPMAHATPAVFAAHVSDRSNRTEIARQMIANEVDVLLGGGEDDFFSQDENGCYFGIGNQPSGSGLVSVAIESGYNYLCNRDELVALNPAPGMKVLGLFAAEEIPAPISPTLSEMTQTALSILSQDPDGFFLMVEAGQIDWAAHELEAQAVLQHTVELDTAVTMALIFSLERENTLLIVAADHETGGMSLNKDGGGSYRQDGPFDMPDGTQFWVDWTTTGHTGANVPVSAQGPYAEMLAGEYHLTRIFEAMAMMLKGGE
ncbi:MAG: alkaline phosphatase [Anaerolineales bacterium]|nr:alkaline phosphatase [Anaerolineales bacterium]